MTQTKRTYTHDEERERMLAFMGADEWIVWATLLTHIRGCPLCQVFTTCKDCQAYSGGPRKGCFPPEFNKPKSTWDERAHAAAIARLKRVGIMEDTHT